MRQRFQIPGYARVILYQFILVSYLSSSCRQPQTPVREWTVKLKNNIGIVHISLPLAYDTLHSWLCESDDMPDNDYYYRIQSFKSSMVEESGFLRYMSDTLYHMTIKNEYFHGDSQIRTLDPHEALANMVEYNRHWNQRMNWTIKIDTGIIYSNGLAYPYYVKADSEYSAGLAKMIFKTKVHTLTCFNNSYIRFDFETTLRKSMDSRFVRESLDAIKSIRIEKYPK